MDAPNPGQRGPKACTACAASKAKCLFTLDTTSANGKCNRCNRLNKHCVMQTPAVRTRRPKNITRVAQLEEKLESIVSQLGASQQPTSIRNDNVPSGTSPYVDTSNSGNTPGGSSSSQYASSPSSHQIAQTLASNTPPDKPNGQVGIDLRNPDTLLKVFRDHISDQFPFVIVPQAAKAFELIHEKPFLFKSIAMVASAQDVKAQARIAEEIVDYVSLHLLIRGEKTLDMLQGLLIFIAWFHCHVHLARRCNTLLGLAQSLLIDLQLCKEPVLGLKRDSKRKEIWAFPEDRLGSEVRTLEERRAYLGCVHLSSMIPLYVNNFDPPHLTHYAQSCINIIQQSPEYQSDHYLVQLMKLQSIAEETSEAFPRDNLEFIPMSSSAASRIKALQTKLIMFEESVPFHLRSNPFLLMQYHSILIFLTEAALYTPSLPTRPAILLACLTSTHSFFSVLFSIPPMHYYKVPYVSWVQMNYALTVLSKLSLFESNDWDLSHVSGIMDLSVVMDGMLLRFEQILETRRKVTGRSDGGEPNKEDGLFGKLIPRFREHKSNFERRRAEIMQKASQRIVVVPQTTFAEAHEPQMQTITAPLVTDMTHDPLMQFDLFDIPPVNFSQLDDAFWQEFMGDYVQT